MTKAEKNSEIAGVKSQMSQALSQINRLNRTLATIEKWSSARKNIDELTSNEIQAYLNSLRNYSNSYITKIHELIYTAFNNAQKKGYIIKNPMTDVIRPKSNKDDKEVYPFGDKKTDIFYKESLDTGRRL